MPQPMKRHRLRACFLPVLFFGFSVSSQNPASSIAMVRPKILGVARIDLRTDNLESATKFYSGVLGLQRVTSYATERSGMEMFEVNPHQFVRLTDDLRDPKQDGLVRIAFETSDAEQLRPYRASHSVTVPSKVEATSNGDRSFRVTDPAGFEIEFIEYSPAPNSPPVAGTSV